MKIKRILLFVFLLIGAVACKYDDDALWDKVNSLDDRISAIEQQLTQANSDISALSVAINALKNNVYVSEVKAVEGGYQITFTDGKKITIKNGKDGANGLSPFIGKNGNWWIGDKDTGVPAAGKDGADGLSPYIGDNGNWWIGNKDTGVAAKGQDAPVISVEMFEGKYYWVQIYNGKQTWLTDKEGNKIPVTGAEGITPILRVNTAGYWIVSYDRGITFVELLDENNNPIKAVGKDGQDGSDGLPGQSGDSFFRQVMVDNGDLVLILMDGTVLRIPVAPKDIVTLPVNLQKSGIENVTFEDCKIVSLTENKDFNSSLLSVKTMANGLPQTFFVSKGNEVYLIGRNPVKSGEKIELSAQTTTLAMVTLHPLFASVKGNDYEKLIQLITNSPKYQAFYDEVVRTINDKRNLYDENNLELLRKFSDLTEDICGKLEVNDGSFDGDITPMSTSASRAIYENAKVYPFYAEINQNTLTLRNTGLTPTYFGTVTHAHVTENIAVKSRSDYGGMDIFKTVGEINLGPATNYTFSSQGDYKFHFSRMTPEATADFYLRLANCLLNSLGLDLGNDALQEIGNSISRALINAGSGVADDVIDPMEWVGIAYNATIEQLKTGKFFKHNVAESIIFISKFAAGSLNWYNRIKGVGNAAIRIGFALSAPKEVAFCLCYYDAKVSTCAEASLYKVSGDQQVGYKNQRLLLPITVRVAEAGDDGTNIPASSYHRVKFEVVSGGGQVESDYVSADYLNEASTYWTLGSGDNQKVKATVVDIITNKEISQPVYFTASMSEASVTIRLDWSQHSGRTDIDLHVVDPFGEEINYYHMNSESGGYLDRDDRVGPGPEHIRWANAPAGTYKIYVHYYPNNDADKSVVSYRVSVNTNDKSYRPVSGSIAYDQTVPIGQFTIGEESGSRVMQFELDSTAPIEIKNYPKKEILK